MALCKVLKITKLHGNNQRDPLVCYHTLNFERAEGTDSLLSFGLQWDCPATLKPRLLAPLRLSAKPGPTEGGHCWTWARVLLYMRFFQKENLVYFFFSSLLQTTIKIKENL